MKTNLNRILTVIMLFVACSSFSLAVSAQTAAPKAQAEERAQKMTAQMQKKLSLTEAQYQPVYDINLKYAKVNEQILKGTDGKIAKLKKLKLTQQNKSRELQAVLTKDQFNQYEEWNKEVKAELKENYKNRTK
jgi:hypothetical protein